MTPTDAAALFSLGARLRSLRKARRWTLKELSLACGVSVSFLSDIERGRCTNMSLKQIEKLSAAFGLSLPEFFDTPVSIRKEADDESDPVWDVLAAHGL
jgi:transcriptional regulator with XRE-family HTH domain